jgi:hypothetical protein
MVSLRGTPVSIHARLGLPQGPQAGARTETITGDYVKSAPWATHSVSDSHAVQELEHPRIAFIKAEALNLDVRTLLDRPHFPSHGALRSQRPEQHRRV